MNTDSTYDEKRHEEAMKSLIIEEICLMIDRLNYMSSDRLWAQRKTDLNTFLATEKLRQLAQEVKKMTSGKEAMDEIVKAICDAKREARDKRFDDGSGPAKCEM